MLFMRFSKFGYFDNSSSTALLQHFLVVIKRVTQFLSLVLGPPWPLNSSFFNVSVVTGAATCYCCFAAYSRYCCCAAAATTSYCYGAARCCLLTFILRWATQWGDCTWSCWKFWKMNSWFIIKIRDYKNSNEKILALLIVSQKII